jgi:hypothetical protein
MSYLLDKTNNASVKITVPDGTIDNTSTSLSLIGRAFVGWGEAINENFLALMENFADSTPPRNALVGQIWYDSTVAKLKYFDGSTFNTLAVYPPLTEGFLYNNNANAVQWLSAASLAPTISSAIFPTNATPGSNAYLQRTIAGPLTWAVATSVLTDALPSGNGFVTKNANGTYSLTATNTITTTAQLTSAIAAAAYTLPTASTSTLGGVKVDGTTISISSGVISAASALPSNGTGYLYNNGGGTLSWSTPSGGGSGSGGGGSSSVDVQTFNSTGTWTKPSGYAMARIQLWGGGGGAGQGPDIAGGGGGAYNEITVPISYLAATVTATVGSGGAGATVPGLGSAGGVSSFALATAFNGISTIYAYGGGGGGDFSVSIGPPGGGQLGLNSPAVAVGTMGFTGGAPLWNGGQSGGFNGGSSISGTGSTFGGGGGGGLVGGVSVYGGAGGVGTASTATAGSAPGGGGGAGGGSFVVGGNGAAGRVVITCWGGGNTTTGGTTLPTQSGNNGKFLTTDGTTLSWGTPSGGGSSFTGGTGLSSFQVQYYINAGSYTWTVPAGVTLLRVQIQSGVYANGSYLVYSSAAGFVTVTPGDSIAVTVGAGGATSSFGTYLSAAGSGTSSTPGAATGSALITSYAIGMVNSISKAFDGSLSNQIAAISTIPAVFAAFVSGSANTAHGYVLIEYGSGGTGTGGGSTTAGAIGTYYMTYNEPPNTWAQSNLPGTWQAMGSGYGTGIYCGGAPVASLWVRTA